MLLYYITVFLKYTACTVFTEHICNYQQMFLKNWMSLPLNKPHLSFRHVDISTKWKLGPGVFVYKA